MHPVVNIALRILAALVLLPIGIILSLTLPWWQQKERGVVKTLTGMIILPCMFLMNISHDWLNG